MFRAELHHFENNATLKLEGRLVGDWAEQAKCLVIKDSVPNQLIVDLSEVTYVDSVGDKVLKWLESVGARFKARGIYAAGICERLQLPFTERLHPLPASDLNRGTT